MAFKGQAELAAALDRLTDPALIARVKTKQAAQMVRRGHAPGGTPVDTGTLRKSMTADENGVGYTVEYAPHVEYGTRYQRGQAFLKKNRDAQAKIFRDDLLKAIREAGG